MMIKINLCKLGKAKEEKRIACEGETLDLKCPISNQMLIVKWANYGRTSKTTCPHAATSDTNCKADKSLSIVKNACDGKHSCSVQVNSNNFGGDPCGGTFKYLEVKYVCGEGNTNTYYIIFLSLYLQNLFFLPNFISLCTTSRF